MEIAEGIPVPSSQGADLGARGLEKKVQELDQLLASSEKPCIAFSGGVDSSLLLARAKMVKGQDVLAVTLRGAMIPQSEIEEISEFVKQYDIRHLFIDIDVLSIPEFRHNTRERCYVCKKHIFGQVIGAAEKNGATIVFDGSNVDDLGDYRPGLKALKELEVISPFLVAGMTKADVRVLASEMGLQAAAKPAMACLATRVPTGSEITASKLKTIEAGEEFLKLLNLSQYRLRYVDDTARLEVGEDDLETVLKNREMILGELKNLGFKSILLDLQGYRTGAMNKDESK